MRALLIVNCGGKRDMKFMVRLQTRKLIEEVNALIAAEQEKKAFRLIYRNAQVEDLIPPGGKIRMKPEIVLIEDAL